VHAFHEVLKSFFSPQSFRASLPDVWAGFQVNLKMMVVAELLVLALALGIAIVRGLPGRAAAPIRGLAIVYTDVFRGTPLILVAFLVGFGLPGLQLHGISTRSNFFYGVLALTLVYTAYVTEVAAQAQDFSNKQYNFTAYVVAAVFFIFLTIPLARFTDHLIAQREARERAQAV